MARYLETLFASERPAALLGGVEVHIAEHHPVDPGEQNGGWRAATLRINFADQPATRMAFGAVRHIVTAARCSTDVFAGLDAAARPYRQLAEMAFFDSLDAVLFMGEDSGTPANALMEVVDDLPENVRSLVTLVGDDCLRCHFVRGINGFVQGASTTSPATMASAFSPMAALIAPHPLPCLDREDVGASPGTALRPVALAEAIWLRRACKLNCARNAGALAVGRARSITAHLIAADLHLAAMAAMTNALRGNATEDCGITCQAPVDALITPYLHCGVAFLALICPARIENPPP